MIQFSYNSRKIEFYDESQARDSSGKWTGGGGGSAQAGDKSVATDNGRQTTTVYHGTSADVLKKIRENGLQPSKGGVYGAGVYATDNIEVALEYGAMKAPDSRYNNPFAPKARGRSFIGLIEVIASGFEEVSRYNDPTRAGKGDKKGASIGILLNKSKVPPSSIKSMKLFDLKDVRSWIFEGGVKPKPVAEKKLEQGVYYVPIVIHESELTNLEEGECPVETQDIKANLANRQEAIDTAHYGPANPKEPNEDYWKAKAGIFKGSVEEAKTMRCGNCAGFNQTSKLLNCIKVGIGIDAEEVTVAGDLGFCEIFDFKCASLRTCDAWIVGGPITDKTNLEQLKADLLSLKEQGATLLYDPSQQRDESGKWAGSGASNQNISETKDESQNNNGEQKVNYDELNKEYENASQENDSEKAEKILQDIAKENGFTEVYHITKSDKPFTEFLPSVKTNPALWENHIWNDFKERYPDEWKKEYMKKDGKLPSWFKPKEPESEFIWVSPTKKDAERLGKFNEFKGKEPQKFYAYLGKTYESKKYLRDLKPSDIPKGYDSASGWMPNANDNKTKVRETAILDPRNIKSSKIFERDNSGNLIVPSKRFDRKTTDIRGSFKDKKFESITINKKTNFYDPSQSRDESGKWSGSGASAEGKFIERIKSQNPKADVASEAVKKGVNTIIKGVRGAKIAGQYGATKTAEIKKWLGSSEGKEFLNTAGDTLRTIGAGAIGAIRGVHNDRYKILVGALINPALVPYLAGQAATRGMFNGIIEEYRGQGRGREISNKIREKIGVKPMQAFVQTIKLQTKQPPLDDVASYLADVLRVSIEEAIEGKERFEIVSFYDPSQDRDSSGKWTGGGGSAVASEPEQGMPIYDEDENQSKQPIGDSDEELTQAEKIEKELNPSEQEYAQEFMQVIGPPKREKNLEANSEEYKKDVVGWSKAFADKKVDKEEAVQMAQSLHEYAGGRHRDINQSVRDMDSSKNLDLDNLAIADSIVSAMEIAPKIKESVIWRGTKSGTDRPLGESYTHKLAKNAKVGQILEDNALLSCSFNESVGRDFSNWAVGNKGVQSKVLMKVKNANGVGVKMPSFASSFINEKEVLLPPETKLKITSVKRTKEPVNALFRGEDTHVYHTQIEAEIVK